VRDSRRMNPLPRLHHNSQTVSLSFETTLIQSCMRKDAPDELVLDYTRAMMAFLLLNPQPQSVLMVGLGGGSMLKYMHKHLPEADITTVEINQAVIDLRDEFCMPPESERHRILCADGAQFLARPPRLYDVILVDGFDGDGLPDALCSSGFFRHVRKALTEQGMMVMNVQADTEASSALIKRAAKAFSGQATTFTSDEGGNDIVLAWQDPTLASTCKQDLPARWEALAPPHQETLAVASTRLERALMRLR
jgi:spermidine synthase